MGKLNSSITRVWPVLEALFRVDPTGVQWLPDLIRLADRHELATLPERSLGPLLEYVARIERPVPRGMLKDLGASSTRTIRNCLEHDLAPPLRFLRWMIANPQALTWPVDSKGNRCRFGPRTQEKRERLLAGDPMVQGEALAALDARGAAGSRRQWWAFEGFTSVDCYLETDSFILLIEGKRTEAVSASTHWYPRRNQIIRNLEVAAEIAKARNKDFAVMLCAETPTQLDMEAFVASLPHFGPIERANLQQHWLGCATWQGIVDALCPALRLPADVTEAIACLTTD